MTTSRSELKVNSVERHRDVKMLADSVDADLGTLRKRSWRSPLDTGTEQPNKKTPTDKPTTRLPVLDLLILPRITQ